VKLFINEKRSPSSTSVPSVAECTLEKIETSSKKYSNLSTKENLLTSKEKELFLFFEDNTGAGDPETGWLGHESDKHIFYAQKAPNLLNIVFSLRLEVRMYKGAEKEALPIGKGVEVLFEILDPGEDFSKIKGPRDHPQKTGKNFVERFIKQMSNGNGKDDNCIQDFAMYNASSNCRIKAHKIDPARLLDKVLLQGGLDDDGKEFGTATVSFSPPPIPGDNYIIKITGLARGGAQERGVILVTDEPNRIKCDYFQTPIITVQKRVKIHMIVLQEGLRYDAIKWNEVKRAYADANIDVSEPDEKHKITIGKDEWIRYLKIYVYGIGNKYSRGWRSREIDAYSKDKESMTKLNKTLDDYSFPQLLLLVPPDHNEKGITSWNLIGLLAKQIIYAKLLEIDKVDLKTFRDPVKGRKIGLCVLFCKSPSRETEVGGRAEGGKVFYVTSVGDITEIFVHEMGHALFLRHGKTHCHHASQNIKTLKEQAASIESLTSIIDHNDNGPYLVDHDSEDLVGCVMSYANDLYDLNGNVLTNNPVYWHFCGVCLLRLRFYDLKRMVQSALFRKMYYGKKLFQVVEKIGDPIKSFGEKFEFQPINFYETSKGFVLNAQKSRELYVLYTSEGTKDNVGDDPCTNLNYLVPGGFAKWVYDPAVAKIEVKNAGTEYVSILHALKPVKKTKIRFEIPCEEITYSSLPCEYEFVCTYCVHCGTVMALGAKECGNCGKAPPLEDDTKVCKNCKAVIPVVAKFCGECGAGQK
jgi:hypothetical protein